MLLILNKAWQGQITVVIMARQCPLRVPLPLDRHRAHPPVSAMQEEMLEEMSRRSITISDRPRKKPKATIKPPSNQCEHNRRRSGCKECSDHVHGEDAGQSDRSTWCWYSKCTLTVCQRERHARVPGGVTCSDPECRFPSCRQGKVDSDAFCQHLCAVGTHCGDCIREEIRMKPETLWVDQTADEIQQVFRAGLAAVMPPRPPHGPLPAPSWKKCVERSPDAAASERGPVRSGRCVMTIRGDANGLNPRVTYHTDWRPPGVERDSAEEVPYTGSGGPRP